MSEKRLVWDIPTRLFHWLLVLSITGSYITAELGFEWTNVHFYLGYFTLGLIAFRIVWGLIGPRHARFTSFVRGPSQQVAYLRSLLKRDSKPVVGHNPGGGLMVVVMLLMVGAQAFSGLFVTDDIAWSGPYNAAVSSEFAGKMGWFHHLNFDILIWVVAMHVLAIIYYRVYKRQNLLVPMFTGSKPAQYVPEQEAISSSELWKALIVAAICAGGVYWLVTSAPPPAEIYY
jgi:cytochrome b